MGTEVALQAGTLSERGLASVVAVFDDLSRGSFLSVLLPLLHDYMLD